MKHILTQRLSGNKFSIYIEIELGELRNLEREDREIISKYNKSQKFSDKIFSIAYMLKRIEELKSHDDGSRTPPAKKGGKKK
jgi:hypothetical protein